MGSSHRAKLLVSLTGTLLVGIGVASAQEGQPAAVAAPQPAVVAPAPEPVLTPAQMLDEGRTTLERMEIGAENIRRQLRDARQAHDVVKALCLDDKLSQMDVAKRTASERLTGLEGAVQSNNGERTKHEFAVLGALRERGEGLVAEANQCIGEETGFVGESRVTLVVDPNIPDIDPQVPTDPLISVPPVLVSPTL